MKNKLVFIDFQPLVTAALALQNQRVKACFLQMEAEAAAAVGGSQNSGLGERAIATVAQSVEQLIRNQQVAGSSPASSSKIAVSMRYGFFL